MTSAAAIDRARDRRRARGGGSARRAIAYALLIGWALLMFVPFAWTIITSLKDRPEALRVSLPASPDFDAWVYTWQSIDPGLPQMIMSSLLLAAIVTASNLFLGSMAGYAFARLTLPRPRRALRDRPGDADDPGPAAASCRSTRS